MKDIKQILTSASIEELHQLRDIVLSADKLSTDDSIRGDYTDPEIAGSALADEICEFGGNSLVNRVRGVFDGTDAGGPDYGGYSLVNRVRGVFDGTGAGGPDYDVIVKDVADKLKAEYPADSSVVEIEAAIIMKILVAAWVEMSEAERESLISECGLSGETSMDGGSVAALEAVFRAGGYKSYQLLAIVVNGVVKQMIGSGLVTGFGLAFWSATLTSRGAALLGPIGWAITGLTTAIQIAGPSYKVTIPSVVYIAYLRRKQGAVQCSECNAIYFDGSILQFCSECGAELPFAKPDVTRYEGGFRDGKPHGKGVMSYPDGTRYEGGFQDGKPHGKGVMSYPDGTRYEGIFRDGKPHREEASTAQRKPDDAHGTV